MKCNLCEGNEMEYKLILSKEDEDTVVVPEPNSDLDKMVSYSIRTNDSQSFKDFNITHAWSCTVCPNVQMEWFDNRNSDAFSKAMNGKTRKDL